MSNEKKQLKMLAPEGFREKLSRRAFLQGGTALAGFALVAEIGRASCRERVCLGV